MNGNVLDLLPKTYAVWSQSNIKLFTSNRSITNFYSKHSNTMLNMIDDEAEISRVSVHAP